MGYPQKLLAPGEVISMETRPHWRALFVPAIILLATVFGATWLYFWIDSNAFGGTIMRWVVLAGGIAIVLLWALVPFLRWVTTEYVFTDRRIIVRSGIITRQGRDMPLSKVNNVSFHVPALGRILNYGALQIESANEDGAVYIADVPNVEEIQREIYVLMENNDARRTGND